MRNDPASAVAPSAVADCETFPALTSLPVIHAFTWAVPGLDVKTDRASALLRLESRHAVIRARLGFGERRFVIAEQTHGAEVGLVNRGTPSPVPGVDALITDDSEVCLGIYVADCGPVFLVDPVRRAIGCVHSGRRGTERGVVANTIERMIAAFGCKPAQMVAQLGPCIRPPNYEVDFAAEILRQCRASGIAEVHDCGACTAADAVRYYSYRRERGQTGRMLALLALRADGGSPED